jgi:hypothetical protein
MAVTNIVNISSLNEASAALIMSGWLLNIAERQ